MPPSPPRPDPRSVQAPLPPGTQAIGQALAAHEVLASLTRRVQESRERLQALLPLLPPAMRLIVQAGPIDESGYTLLVPHQAALVKLRQMAPLLQTRLKNQGFGDLPLRVKLVQRV